MLTTNKFGEYRIYADANGRVSIVSKEATMSFIHSSLSDAYVRQWDQKWELHLNRSATSVILKFDDGDVCGAAFLRIQELCESMELLGTTATVPLSPRIDRTGLVGRFKLLKAQRNRHYGEALENIQQRLQSLRDRDGKAPLQECVAEELARLAAWVELSARYVDEFPSMFEGALCDAVSKLTDIEHTEALQIKPVA